MRWPWQRVRELERKTEEALRKAEDARARIRRIEALNHIIDGAIMLRKVEGADANRSH